MGRFERNLDVDLIERMQSGWRPHSESKPLKKQKETRAAVTYRAARRNLASLPWPGLREKGKYFRPPLVRSRSARGEEHCQRPGRRVREKL